MKIMLIGFGHLANTIAHEAVKQGIAVYGVKRLYRKSDTHLNFDGIQMIWKDLFDLKSADLDGIDVVIYCPSAKNSENDHIRTFRHGSAYILKLCNEKQNPPLFMFVSSTGIYHQHQGEWINEDSDCYPTKTSAQILLDTENIVMEEEKVPTVILRPSGIYGTHRFKMLEKLKNGKLHYTMQPHISNRIHVLDCAQAILHIMLMKDRKKIYIISDSEPTPSNTIYGWLSASMGIPITHENHDMPSRGGHRYISNARLLETGFKLNYPSYKQGIKAILIEQGHLPPPF